MADSKLQPFKKKKYMTFTRKNVLRAVWTVKNTDDLGYYLRVPPSIRYEINLQFLSDPQQVKKAYINYFMDHDPLASWRRVIVSLDVMREKESADNIRHLAERVTDPTLNISNLCLVMASVKNWYDLGHYGYGLGVPFAVRNKIRASRAYQTADEQKVAFLQYYLDNVAMASWQSVAGALHRREEKTALQIVKDFLTPAAESSLTPDNLSTVLDKMEDWLWEVYSRYVNTPVSERERIRIQYSSNKDCKQAVIHYFISNHPAPSWTLVAHALYQMGYKNYDESCLRSLDRLQQLFPTGRRGFSVESCDESSTTTSETTPTQQSTEHTLDIDNLFDVWSEILDVAHKWKGLGLALRLRPPVLNKIEADRQDSESRLMQVLTEWLQQTYDTDRFGPPSWRQLVTAVAHTAGGNNRALAQQIAHRHNGGQDMTKREGKFLLAPLM